MGYVLSARSVAKRFVDGLLSLDDYGEKDAGVVRDACVWVGVRCVFLMLNVVCCTMLR